MESPSSPKGGMPDFTFGLNDPSYSDRTLRLEILDEIESDDDNLYDLERNTKRRHRVKETQVKTIHINTLILASRSTFFRKLFSNGMLESLQKDVTLRIDTSEEASFMDLLKYLYSNNLPTSMNALLDLCVIADKFEVVSCLKDCVQSLQSFPMTCELASIYLDLPQSLLMRSSIRKLVDAAKKFLVAKFKDFHKFKKEMLSLPLAGIKEVLASDDLQATSKCVVYDFVLTWARKHYPDLEERRGILKTHLLDLVRFPFMTTTKLTEEVQTCSDIDPEVASKIVIHAVCYIAKTPLQKRCLTTKDRENTASRQFVERAYKCLPVNVVELDANEQSCIVFLHFPEEKLKQIIIPGCQIMSETFQLGGQEFVLFGETCRSEFFCLGLKVLGSATVTVDYEIKLRMRTISHQEYIFPKQSQFGMMSTHNKPEYAFQSWVSGSHTFTGPERIKYLKDTHWNWIKNGRPNNNYLIDENNVLKVMAELTIKK